VHNPLFSLDSTAILELRNVNITQIRYEPKAVFLLNQGASLLLTNVYFSNILPQYPLGAVILQPDSVLAYPADSGYLLFAGGGVELLYNGLDPGDLELKAGSFVRVDGMRDVVVQHVLFERNIAWNLDESVNSLLYFKRFRTLLRRQHCFRRVLSY
jgi:hypothetical protein